MSMEVLSQRTALLSNVEVLHLLREYESEQLARQKTALRVKKEEEERERERVGFAPASGAATATATAIAIATGLDLVDPNVNVNASLTYLQEEVCENLRTVEFEAIQYLTAAYLPTKRRRRRRPHHSATESESATESVASLVKSLNKYDLTKAEKLQIVNLAPVEAVELYVIVEEIEDRFSEEQMEEILSLVRSSLSSSSSGSEPEVIPPEMERRARDIPSSNLDPNRAGWEDAEDGPEPEPGGGPGPGRGDRDGDGDLDAQGEELEFDDSGTGMGVEGDLEMGDEDED